MFKNYLKLSLRNLWKNKIFSAINIGGLSIGIAASLILFLHVKTELAYDKFHEGVENIYRVRLDNLNGENYSERLVAVAGPVGKAMKEAFPEIEEYAQLESDNLSGMISSDSYKFRIQKSYFASQGFFNVFSFGFFQGDKNTALRDPGCVVISESMAKKFFGAENAVGKTLKFNKNGVFKVTGVFHDVPENSHIKFDLLVSFATLTKYISPYMEHEWNSGESVYTYLKLKPGTNPKQLEKKFVALVDSKLGPELKAKGLKKNYTLQPFGDIHLKSHFDFEMAPNGDSRAIYFFIVIACMVLIIAWVNYINLATVQSFGRSREIGIRMVTGATRNELRRQFVFEAVLLNCIALALAIFLVKAVYPWFTRYTGMEISGDAWYSVKFWILFAIAFICGVVLSGLYPAFVLSSVNPVKVLKGKSVKRTGGFAFRKTLIAFQFVVSMALITGTIVVLNQVSFMRQQKTGVQTEHVIVVHKPSVTDSTWHGKRVAFRNSLKQFSSIEEVTLSRYVPGEPIHYTQSYIRQSDNPSKAAVICHDNYIDKNYLDLYRLRLLAGRDFDAAKEDLEVIIDRRAMEVFGFKNPQSCINQKIYNEGWKYAHTIVGVIENFHQQSLKEKFVPTVYMHFSEPVLANKYSIRVHSANLPETISQLESVWNKIYPGDVLEYFFLDEQYNNQYKADVQFGRIFLLFSALAIGIACVGLFALTLFTILQRTREIAIRKVVGASLKEIFSALTKEYFLLALVAAALAIPLMYFVMHNWLQNYAYRISLCWWHFAVPLALLTLVITISITWQVLKVARANPVKALKYE